MRGHGFAAVGVTVHDVVRLSVYLPVNARMITAAMRLAPNFRPLAPGEIDVRGTFIRRRRRSGAPGNTGRVGRASPICSAMVPKPKGCHD